MCVGGAYETQWSALRGCLRRELRGTVCISWRSRNPTRHLEEFMRGAGTAVRGCGGAGMADINNS